MLSLNTMGPNMPLHGVPMGPHLTSYNSIMRHRSQEPLGTLGRDRFTPGLPPAQSPPVQFPFPHSGPCGRQHNFPVGTYFPSKYTLGLSHHPAPKFSRCSTLQAWRPRGHDALTVLGSSMSLVFVDPNLWEDIWPGVTRIPEFDQPYITPSEKLDRRRWFTPLS
jgi:hypothetical protein